MSLATPNQRGGFSYSSCISRTSHSHYYLFSKASSHNYDQRPCHQIRPGHGHRYHRSNGCGEDPAGENVWMKISVWIVHKGGILIPEWEHTQHSMMRTYTPARKTGLCLSSNEFTTAASISTHAFEHLSINAHDTSIAVRSLSRTPYYSGISGVRASIRYTDA